MVASGVGGSGGGGGGGRVIQVTNIAPQATKDQMGTLFGYLGRVDDIRLYPTVRDVSCPVTSRTCWLRYADSAAAAIAPHLTNTVFIDRALIVVGVPNATELPDEHRAMQMTGVGGAGGPLLPGLSPAHEPRLPAHLVNTVDGIPPNQVIQTHDPRLPAAGLPAYPPLPAAYNARQIEEIRRTLLAIDLDPEITSQQIIDHFSPAGQVKYVRFCDRDSDALRYALIEFTEQESIVKGLKLNGTKINGHVIKVHHATQGISKPQTKSNEAAQREIEEAMCRVKEAQNLISAAIDPVIGLLSKEKRRSHSRSRSRRRSRSRQRSRRSRSRSRHRSRRSRSRSRRRRHRSRSRSSHRRSHSRRSRSRGKGSRSKRDRSRNKDKERETKEKDRSKKEEKEIAAVVEKESSLEKRRSVSKEPSKEKHRSRSREKKSRERKHSKSRDRERKRSRSREKREKRSRSRGKRRSRSRERKRSRSRERKRTRSRERKRSRSRDRRRSRSKERKRSKSGDRKRSHSKSGSKPRTKSPSLDVKRESNDRDDGPKVARDYDEEERGFEADGGSAKSEEYNATPDARSKDSPDNMDISNSP